MDTLNGEILTPRTVTADRLVARSITAEEIAANTITANEVNVADIFAQDIAATGTIRGLRIVGATGDFTGTVNASDGVFRGTVYASEGEFTGKVTATSGSFTGTVNATDGVFRGAVYASAGEFTGIIRGETIDIDAKKRELGELWVAGVTANIERGISLFYTHGDGCHGEINMMGTMTGIRNANNITMEAVAGEVYIRGPIVTISTDYGLRVDGGIDCSGLSCSSLEVNAGTGVSGINLGGNGALVYDQHGDGNIYFRYKTSASAGYSYTNVNSIISTLASKAASNHTHNYAAASHTHSYLPLSGGTVTGNMRVDGNTTTVGWLRNNYAATNTVTSAANAHISGNVGTFNRVSSSSKRYKHDIRPLADALEASNLLSVPVVQYIYNADYLSEDDPRYGKCIPGFIAEDVAELYPVAAETDAEGRVEDWNIRMVVPPMLQLIQENYKTLAECEKGLSIMGGRQESTETSLSDLRDLVVSQEREIQILKEKIRQLQCT